MEKTNHQYCKELRNNYKLALITLENTKNELYKLESEIFELQNIVESQLRKLENGLVPASLKIIAELDEQNDDLVVRHNYRNDLIKHIAKLEQYYTTSHALYKDKCFELINRRRYIEGKDRKFLDKII